MNLWIQPILQDRTVEYYRHPIMYLAHDSIRTRCQNRKRATFEGSARSPRIPNACDTASNCVAQWRMAKRRLPLPGTDPNTLGIRAGGRVESLYVSREPVQVLQSTAADIPAWDGSGVTYPGGGIQ